MPISRNSQNFINEVIVCEKVYSFELDEMGNVIGITESPVTSTNRLDLHEYYKVFPNPVSDQLYIQPVQSDGTSNFQIEIYDLKGRLMYKGENEERISLTHFSEAVLILKIHDIDSGQIFTTKIQRNQ